MGSSDQSELFLPSSAHDPGVGLRSPEWVALGYFAVLALIALSRKRPRALVGSALAAFTVVVVARVPEWFGQISAVHLGWIRDWAPPVFVLLGYWMPAQLLKGVHLGFERWLLDSDHRWIGGLLRRAERAPRLLVELAEAAYLCCYPMIPGGMVLPLVGGYESASDRYWTALIWAAALSYGPLAFAVSRPPRVLEPRSSNATNSTIRRLNLFVLGRASVQLNTCPSGHVATAVAATLAVWSVWPAAGIALGVLTALIAIASVTGRYHYAFDAITGVAVGAVGFALS
ncbi:MAG: phosphatase PAP2 family protein [Acidimicrobiia bacterium]|nr:phosphatase PAP2 family protein [Acidimicrobiia bacterium]